MTDIEHKRMAVGAGMISLTLLVMGSLLTGARLITAFERGILGFILFGGLAWCLGLLFPEEAPPPELMEDIFEGPEVSEEGTTNNEV